MWQYNALLLSESILALTLGLYLLALYRLWDRPSIGAAAFAGVTLALAGYNRAELLLLGVLAIPIVLRNPHLAGARVRVGRIVVVGVVAVAAVAPWTIRNLTTFQRPVLFSDNVDSVLAGANCPKTYSGREIGGWNSGCYAAVFRPGWDESVAFSEARHAGTLYFRRHLDEVPLVVLARVGREWGFFKPFEGIGNDGRDAWLWIASASFFWLSAVLGAVGAVMLRRAGRMMWPLASIAGFVTLLAMVTYGSARLRAPLDIVLLVLAAVPIERGLTRVFGGGGADLAPSAADHAEAPAVAPSSDAAIRARSTASAAPLTTRYSVLRRCDTSPTRSPARLWIADLRADVALASRRRAISTVAAGRAHVDELVERDPALVVVRHDHDTRVDASMHAAQRVGHRRARLNALFARVGELDALARDAVVLGLVPRDERLPHVVVRLSTGAGCTAGRGTRGRTRRAPATQRDRVAADRRARARRAARARGA